MQKGVLGASEAALVLRFDTGAAPQLCSGGGDSVRELYISYHHRDTEQFHHTKIFLC